MKKFLALALTLLSIFAVAACGDSDDGDQAHVDEARERLLLAAKLDSIRSDINLPTELGNYPDVEIVWSSSNPDIVTADGTVTGPEEGNINVTLTATLTYNEVTAERQYALTVMEAIPENLKEDFSALYEEDPIGEIVTLKGTVTSRFSGGAFLFDGETHMAIYDAPNYDIQDYVELGDEIKYTGEFAKYNTLFQATARLKYEVLNSGVEYDVSPQEVDIEALYDYEPAGADKDVHGKHFIVEGMISIKGADDNIFIEDIDSDKQLEVYEFSLQNSLDALEAREGDIVSVEIVYYTLYSSGDIRVVFQGGESDIQDVEADTETMLNQDIKNVEDTYTETDTVTLPSTGSNGTTFSGWTSSDATVIADDGTVATQPTNLTTVTFTGTASLDDMSEEVTFEAYVLGTEAGTAADIFDIDKDEIAHIEGIVYSLFNGGYFIYDGANSMAVYNGVDISESEFVIGDAVEVLGYKDAYHSLPQLSNTEFENKLTSGNTINVPVDATKTVAEVYNLDAETNPEVHGQIFEVTGSITVEGEHNNVFINDLDGTERLEVYYNSPSTSISELEGYEGQTVTVQVIYYNNEVRVVYQNGAEGITVVE